MDESKPSFFKRLFKGDEKTKGRLKLATAGILFAIVVIIFLSSFAGTKTSKTKTAEQNEEQTFLSLEYCKQLENRLKNVLTSVKGAGDVEVFVMVDSSPTYQYLSETEKSTSGQGESTVVNEKVSIYETKNGSTSSPVVVNESLPKIIGVVVIAGGAGDAKLKATLKSIVASLLNVELSCVEVLEGKQ